MTTETTLEAALADSFSVRERAQDNTEQIATILTSWCAAMDCLAEMGNLSPADRANADHELRVVRALAVRLAARTSAPTGEGAV